MFESGDYWRIIINSGSDGALVKGSFETAEEAIERATDISNGEDCDYVEHLLGSAPTEWRKQKKKHNGSPTYGRITAQGVSISVKKAASGKWFYVKFRGTNFEKPVGWFDTADKACIAADGKYLG